jgi:DNA-binding ferritin-like protein
VEASKFIGRLFHARDTAHLYHLSLSGPGAYAAHVAAENFYDNLLDFTDTLIESHQGKYGLLSLTIQASYTEVSKDFPTYLKALLTYIETECPFVDSDELNIIDEIKTLIKQTLYKLTYLK